MARPTDTRARIQAVARELFARQGVRQTSLREIAQHLGITKPALYYHFDSREALLRSIVQPMIDEMDAFVAVREAAPRIDTRILLADYFDMLARNRDILGMLVRDLGVFGELDLAPRMFDWRRRLLTLLLGPDPPLAARVRAVVAIGGMSDCALEFADLPPAQLKAIAVDAACTALGLSPADAPTPAPAPAPTRRTRTRRRAT